MIRKTTSRSTVLIPNLPLPHPQNRSNKATRTPHAMLSSLPYLPPSLHVYKNTNKKRPKGI